MFSVSLFIFFLCPVMHMNTGDVDSLTFNFFFLHNIGRFLTKTFTIGKYAWILSYLMALSFIGGLPYTWSLK